MEDNHMMDENENLLVKDEEELEPVEESPELEVEELDKDLLDDQPLEEQPLEEELEAPEEPLLEEEAAPAEEEPLLGEEVPAEESLDEDLGLDDLSLELEPGDEIAPVEEEEELIMSDALVSEDQGKYADGFPDWNLEPPLN